LRICSFLPSATEIVYALGVEDSLLGVTHECDYPADARSKPKLTKSLLATEQDSATIDKAVRESLGHGAGIYEINFDALSKANPDLIFAQELCEVCAVPYGEIFRAAKKLGSNPEVVSLDTFTLSDILAAIKTVGEKCGRLQRAEGLVESLNERIRKVQTLTSAKARKKSRIFFMEWIDPIMSGGHWMPELIEIAGGTDAFSERGKNSKRVKWRSIIDYSPDYLIIAPCGFGVQRAAKEAEALKGLEGWNELPAVKNGNVYVVDGNAYFSRPGPRIVDGLEILAEILNPGLSSKLGTVYGEKDYTRLHL